jgi:hypothetical protein
MTHRSRFSAIESKVAGSLFAFGIAAASASLLPACSRDVRDEGGVSASARLEGEYTFTNSAGLKGIYFEKDRYVLVATDGEVSIGNFTFDDRVLRLEDARTGSVASIRFDAVSLGPLGAPREQPSVAIRSTTEATEASDVALVPGENGCQGDAFASGAPASESASTPSGDAGASDETDVPTTVPASVGVRTGSGLISGGADGADGGAIVGPDGGPIVDLNGADGLLCASVKQSDGAAKTVCCGTARVLRDGVVDGVKPGVNPEPLSRLVDSDRLGNLVQGGGGQVCSGGACNLAEVRPGTPCTTNKSCNFGAKGTGVICSTQAETRGRCVEGCDSDEDCASGSTCSKTAGRGRCSPASPPLGTACNGDNAACNGGKTGTGRVCSAASKQCIIGCHSDSDCSPGARCDRSRRPAWVCTDGTPDSTSPGGGGNPGQNTINGHTFCEFAWEERSGYADYTTIDWYLRSIGRNTTAKVDRPQNATLQGSGRLSRGDLCENARILKPCFDRDFQRNANSRSTRTFAEWCQQRGLNPVRVKMALSYQETLLGKLNDSCSGGSCNGIGIAQIISAYDDNLNAISNSDPRWEGITHNVLTNLMFGTRVLAEKVINRRSNPYYTSDDLVGLARAYNGNSNSSIRIPYGTRVNGFYQDLGACGIF